jgi:hypothetical protein
MRLTSITRTWILWFGAKSQGVLQKTRRHSRSGWVDTGSIYFQCY